MPLFSEFPNLLRVKNISSEVPESERPLKRVLGPVDLTMLGIGAIVGAGIFATVGTAAVGDETRPGAGPALVVSFVLTAIACSFAALCYAELASLARVAGSAYSYAYATLGELVAWIIGWDLVLEYAVGNVAVAVSWSGYFQSLINPFLHAFHDRYPAWVVNEFPKWLGSDIRSALDPATKILESAPRVFGVPIIFNFPAVFIVTAITAVLVIGVKESAWFNTVMVAIKLVVLAFFCIVGAFYIRPENLHPFAPNGWQGIQAGAAVVFFAFIGFDAVSTAAEECRNPRRDLPIGILGSLGICTLIYVLVAFVLTGMCYYEDFKVNVNEPLSVAMTKVNLVWAAVIVAFGSVVAHTAVLLVFQLGQPRILYAMSRDRLLPKVMAKTHPRFRTPHVATMLTGVFVAVGSALASLDEMADLCNIGTLSAFIIVCAGVIVLRWRGSNGSIPRRISALARRVVVPGNRGPQRSPLSRRITALGRLLLAVTWWPARGVSRGFHTPLVPLFPLLGVASCLWLTLGLPQVAWIRFGVWLVVGLVFYLVFGSLTRRTEPERPVSPSVPSAS